MIEAVIFFNAPTPRSVPPKLLGPSCSSLLHRQDLPSPFKYPGLRGERGGGSTVFPYPSSVPLTHSAAGLFLSSPFFSVVSPIAASNPGLVLHPSDLRL
jgi:hypothetical protein